MPSRRVSRPVRIGWECLGVLLAATTALLALAHALAGAKRSLLLDDGDSVLLPLMLRSFERGEPFEWGMSPVLFAVPELPLYLASAAVTHGVAASLLLNGVVNVVALYVLLRFIAGRALRTTNPQDPATRARRTLPTSRPITAALLGTAVFVGACLLETRPGGNTGEIASLYLTTTYYSGTVMALLATLGVVLHLAGPTDGRGRRILLPALTIGLIAALATFSNPLYVLWVTGPLVIALAGLAVLRFSTRLRDPWWRPAATSLALVAGSGVGYLGRQPFQRFIIADKDLYLRWGQDALSLSFGSATVRALVATPGGLVEAVLAGVLLVGSVTAAILAVGRRGAGGVALVALFGGVSVILVPVALLVTGSISTRYALPLLFTPLALLVVGIAVAPVPSERSTRRIIALGLAVVSVSVVAVAVPAGVAVARAATGPGEPAAACLTRWATGKHVAGAAQFWTGRGLDAYGGPQVDLLQVNADLSVYPWLVNLASYRNARVGYVVVAKGGDSAGHYESWGDSLTALGTPRDIVDCGGYEIYDFRGLPAEATLTKRIDESADVLAAFQGFGW